MPNRRAVLFLAVSVLFSLPSAAEELRPGSVIEHEISGTKTDAYAILLAAGEFADIVVDQKGIDVIVRVLDSAGTLLTEIDNESKPFGQEHTTIVADKTTTYQLTVRPRYPKAPAGNYVVHVLEVRPAGEKDRELFEAEKGSTEALYGAAKGNLEKCLTAAMHALELGELALAPTDPYIGSLILRRAFLERTLGHYSVARDEFRRAEGVYEASLGRDHPQTALAIEGVALTYMSENDWVKAEPLLEQAKDINERALGDHPRALVSLLDLSIVRQKLGDKQMAIADLEHALRIAENYLDANDFSLASVIGNLGSLYCEMGDYDRAEPMEQRALHVVETKFGPDHLLIAEPLEELAIIARERKDYDTALAMLWRAEGAEEKAYGLRHQRTAGTLSAIAKVYAAEGDYAKAIDLQQRALELLETAAGPYHSLTLGALGDLAKSYSAVGNVPCAIEYEARADEVLEKNLDLNLVIGSERQKLAYADSTSEQTDRTISLHVASHDPSAAELALLVLLQRKGRVLDAMSDTFETVRRQLKPDDRLLLDRLRGTTAELAKIALSGPGKTPAAEYRERLHTLEGEKEQLEARISARSEAFRAESRPVTIPAVREAIPANGALVEFSVYRPYDPRASSYGKPHYIVYVLRRRGPIAWKDLGDAAAVDRVIAGWRNALRDPQDANAGGLGRVLDRRLMAPVRALIGDSRHLLISPDGQLDLIPFEALVDARGHYLVERYAISYVSSGRDLLRMTVPRRSETPPVIVADPLFGEPEGHKPLKLASVESPRRGITASDDASTVYFGPLAGTREEARSIHDLFPEARVLTGGAATKRAIQNVDAPLILHIATHGFFLQNGNHTVSMASGTRSVSATVTTPNPLLRSGLALTGANLSNHDGDGGVLTALEASTLNLWGTKLVTLSACDSGVGEVKNREGVYGLRRAFFLAGAETVVMSLWPVSDYVTRQMMTAYYSGLKRGLGRGEALRSTELSMLHDKQRRHPFYWASFIQSGDWRNLRDH